MRTPILVLIFNRPELSRGLFDILREARPPRLYIAADGPREHVPGEFEACGEARAVFDNVDWPCKVFRLFRKRNLGCGQGVATGITWFFQHEPEGVILEDDIRPTPQFFRFCDAMLARYRDDERVMQITGNNFQFGLPRGNAPWYFSIFNHIWGWASWARSWQYYQFSITHTTRLGSKLTTFFEDPSTRKVWADTFRAMEKSQVDTWDYQWTYAHWLNGGLTVTPNANLASNAGFSVEATHTTTPSLFSDLPVEWIDEDWKALIEVAPCKEADEFISRLMFTSGLDQFSVCIEEVQKRIENGQARMALPLLKKMQLTWGDVPLLLQSLSLAYIHSGDGVSALPHIEKLLSINSSDPIARKLMSIIHSIRS